jgi:hypothetical protein
LRRAERGGRSESEAKERGGGKTTHHGTPMIIGKATKTLLHPFNSHYFARALPWTKKWRGIEKVQKRRE